jgi:predicted RNA-binding Zn ribbon-like protein
MALPAWVPDTETKPAPMPLLLVQSFVNTWEADAGTDLLGDPDAASRWLHGAGLLDRPAADEADAAAARAVRECIRAMLVHNGGGPAPGPSALQALRVLAEGCRFLPIVWAPGTVEVEPDAGAGMPWVARLLLIIRDAQGDGTWSRLKACRNPDCRWAYYDRSHAGRGAWCDMAVCGNRIKNRNLRSRRSGAAARPTAGPAPT